MNKDVSKKVLNGAAYSTIIAAWLIAGVILWLIIWPVSPGTIINSIEAPEQASPGDTVSVLVDYCKDTPGRAESLPSLVTQDQTFYFEPINSSRPTGCDRVGFEFTIPESAPIGQARFEVDILREYNVFNSEIISDRSNNFEIVE